MQPWPFLPLNLPPKIIHRINCSRRRGNVRERGLFLSHKKHSNWNDRQFSKLKVKLWGSNNWNVDYRIFSPCYMICLRELFGKNVCGCKSLKKKKSLRNVNFNVNFNLIFSFRDNWMLRQGEFFIQQSFKSFCFIFPKIFFWKVCRHHY